MVLLSRCLQNKLLSVGGQDWMIILKAIGAFFVRIWRWIKDTAWVQPLLIVGAIFAIIFSIPYITQWAESVSGSSTDAFYSTYQVSLEGETYDENSASPADLLTNNVYENTVTKFYAGQTDFELGGYGQKYFLVYVKKDCSSCASAEGGFRFLSENWDNARYGLVPSDGRPFAIKTIFSSEVSSNDDDYKISLNGASAFNRYLSIHSDLFNQTGPPLYEAPYRINASVAETNYSAFSLNPSTSSSTSPVADFPVPSICLVDYSPEAVAIGRAGLSEVLFGVTGDTDAARAKLLLDMWNHTDSYAKDPNNLFVQKDVA
jgi:hypothetical protein